MSKPLSPSPLPSARVLPFRRPAAPAALPRADESARLAAMLACSGLAVEAGPDVDGAPPCPVLQLRAAN